MLGGLVALVTALTGHGALAQETTAKFDSGDTAWMLTSTAIVLMMTIPGVALFYGGMVRKKNVLATLMQSFTICCLVTVLWMVIGFSLAFDKAGPFIGGLGRMFLDGMEVGTLSGTIPESVFVIFQATFAIITAALITGAVAERTKFSALLWFIGLWTLIVYSPVAYWVWGGRFLGDAGVLDFAGGTVVHINSGIAGLVAALVLGKRTGYGTESLAPHNMVLSVIGAAMLWVGWFGFNASSAAAAAALAWLACEWVHIKKPTVLGIVSGAVGGLVAITLASGFVDPKGALAIGIIAGIVCYWGAAWLKPKLGYDDSLDVFAVQGLGGIAGADLTGVFAVEAIGGTPGLIEGNPGQVVTQVYGIVVTIAYCGVASFILLKIIDAVIGLRVDPDIEREGLDLPVHGETVQ